MAAQSKTPATAQPPTTTNVRPPPRSNTSYQPRPFFSSQLPPPAPPTHRNQPRNAEIIRRADSIFFCIRLIFLGIGLIVILLCLMIFHPDLPTFRVDSVTISNFNISTTTPPLLSGYFNIGLTVENPSSKTTFSYSHLEAGIYLGSNQLSGTTLPPFTAAEKKNATGINAEFSAVRAYTYLAETQNLELCLKVQMEVHSKARFWREVQYLEASCPGLLVSAVKTQKNGSSSDVWSLIGGVKDCEVF
ncbi:uncharacterized protein [Coffea arabica]|uniref:Late embryogenesis abundant protein LEA-2 subgroup domain-containing protein n=1 Tax=Coffea arabica TaxID=13443 RepID=A0ABM4WM49_COFAR